MPPFPAPPGSGCPPAATGRCDDRQAESSHLRSNLKRLVAHCVGTTAHHPALDHEACPARPARHPRRPPRPGDPPGHREPHLGIPAHPRRARRPRLPDRRLDGLDDPARSRDRSRTASGRTVLERSSCARRRTRSWPATCSTSTPSPCTGCMRSSSSSTPPAACTSSASPPTRPAPG